MITVSVRQSHIDAARKLLRSRSLVASCCPVALALKETGYRSVVVGPDMAFVDEREYKTSPSTKQWIIHFDCKHAVAPFLAVLEPTFLSH